MAAYLLFAEGREKDEGSIMENLPPYKDIYESSLGEDGDRARAGDAVRKQLARDVEALSGAGIRVEVEGEADGRRYRLPASGFSPLELDLSAEERSVLVGALRAFRRDFPYAGPLRLAVANLVGAASAGAEDLDENEALHAAVVTREDEGAAKRVAALEGAVARRKRVRFGYYSISRDEASEREVEPYAISLLDGVWYVTGWDTKKEAVRQFRVSRIRSRVVLATKKESGDFEVPENFSRRFAGPRAPWQLGKPDRRARVRVSPAAFSAARRRYLWAVSMDRREEGGARILSTPFSGERQLAGWILSLGEEALALSPRPLVGRVVEGLERIAEAHAPEEGRTS
ncbi:MAG: WYL domain-containing protein [Actinomycetota bacterium]|nr:WYL domain-containing protein [Actinomycetota bacterium]